MLKKIPTLIATAVFAGLLFTACNDGEEVKTTTDKKTAADSAAISPMDTRDTGRLDTVGKAK